MRIKVPNAYIGLDTHGRMIYPGEYDLDDSALYGVGPSLLETGYAQVMADGSDSKPGIEDLTAAELKEMAAGRGLEFASRATKADLIALLENAPLVEDNDETDGEAS